MNYGNSFARDKREREGGGGIREGRRKSHFDEPRATCTRADVRVGKSDKKRSARRKLTYL